MTDPEASATAANVADAASAAEADGGESAADPLREAVVEARLAAVAVRFGDRWDDEQRAHVRRDIGRGIDLAARLRRAPLGNADEPEIVFVPYRAADGGGR